jgi:hypothetical protein
MSGAPSWGGLGGPTFWLTPVPGLRTLGEHQKDLEFFALLSWAALLLPCAIHLPSSATFMGSRCKLHHYQHLRIAGSGPQDVGDQPNSRAAAGTRDHLSEGTPPLDTQHSDCSFSHRSQLRTVQLYPAPWRLFLSQDCETGCANSERHEICLSSQSWRVAPDSVNMRFDASNPLLTRASLVWRFVPDWVGGRGVSAVMHSALVAGRAKPP